VHLDIVEDLTNEATPMPSKGTWRWGVVDGEVFMRDRGERITDNNRDHRRRDEDDDHDRRGRSGGRGWGSSSQVVHPGNDCASFSDPSSFL
jgi:hypothetical protein